MATDHSTVKSVRRSVGLVADKATRSSSVGLVSVAVFCVETTAVFATFVVGDGFSNSTTSPQQLVNWTTESTSPSSNSSLPPSRRWQSRDLDISSTTTLPPTVDVADDDPDGAVAWSAWQADGKKVDYALPDVFGDSDVDYPYEYAADDGQDDYYDDGDYSSYVYSVDDNESRNNDSTGSSWNVTSEVDDSDETRSRDDHLDYREKPRHRSFYNDIAFEYGNHFRDYHLGANGEHEGLELGKRLAELGIHDLRGRAISLQWLEHHRTTSSAIYTPLFFGVLSSLVIVFVCVTLAFKYRHTVTGLVTRWTRRLSVERRARCISPTPSIDEFNTLLAHAQV